VRASTIFATATLASVAACASHGSTPPAPSAPEGERYLTDTAFRRAELEASLVSKDNDYAKLRLAHYAGGDARWDALPEWNPRVDPVLPSELDDGTAARTTMSGAASALAIDPSLVDDDSAMRALGARAFTAYPTQLAPYAALALASRAAADGYGLFVDDSPGGAGVGSLVRAQVADGSAALALTCATCHARRDGSGIVLGVGNDRLDLGGLLARAAGAPATSPYAAWGPGRVDVTTNDGTAPVRIPDLRPTAWLTYLHHDATVAKRDRTALAIRLETLILTSHDEAIRPPRLVAWALAVYLESLADSLPSGTPATDAATRGSATFASACASCHAPPGLTGAPVPLSVIGTDPAIGLSSDRGTGTYRVPSLHGVGSRPLLLHDASIASLEAMFDPARTTDTFTAGTHGPGAVKGHAYGLDLDAAARADLIAYLTGL
jgi:mono/diheme cytochrome c family protein